MPTFSEVAKRLPPDSVTVPIEAFNPLWDERPDGEVCIGLRFLPEQELEDARIEAFRRANKLFPDHQRSMEATTLWIASFHDALMRWVIARGTCDPNNIEAAWSGWEAAPEDMVPIALTDQGTQHIFDAWERMRIAANIGIVAASDADLLALPQLLPRLAKLDDMSHSSALRLRRLLRFVLEELEAVPVDDEEPDPTPPTPAPL